MKKRSFASVLVAAMLCILVTGAFAATMNIFGLGDFLSQYSESIHTTVTKEFSESVKKENIMVETDHAVYTIFESYYDEVNVRIAMTIRPKEDVLLIGQYAYQANDDLWSIYPNQIEPDTTTIAEYAGKNHGGRIVQIRARLNMEPDKEPEWEGEFGTVDFWMNEDGSVTLYCLWEVGTIIKLQEEKDVLLYMHYTPNTPSGDEEYLFYDLSNDETVTIPLTLHFTGNTKYVCDEDLDFPEAGVKVTKVVITVNPLDIYCQLNYKVTDFRNYSNAQRDNTMLLFQFVYPDSSEQSGFKAFPAGFGGGITTHTSDYMNFQAEFSVTRDALNDHYILRVFNRELDQMFEAVEFTVKPME